MTKFINSDAIMKGMGSSTNFRRDAIKDLIKIKEEFASVVDSLELMSDEEFIKSHKKAKDDIKKRKFDDWNEL